MLEKKINNFQQQQSEDTVASAKAQVWTIAVAGSSTDSLVLAIEVASRHGHPEMTLFRDFRAQAYVSGGPSFSQICLNYWVPHTMIDYMMPSTRHYTRRLWKSLVGVTEGVQLQLSNLNIHRDPLCPQVKIHLKTMAPSFHAQLVMYPIMPIGHGGLSQLGFNFPYQAFTPFGSARPQGTLSAKRCLLTWAGCKATKILGPTKRGVRVTFVQGRTTTCRSVPHKGRWKDISHKRKNKLLLVDMRK